MQKCLRERGTCSVREGTLTVIFSPQTRHVDSLLSQKNPMPVNGFGTHTRLDKELIFYVIDIFIKNIWSRSMYSHNLFDPSFWNVYQIRLIRPSVVKIGHQAVSGMFSLFRLLKKEDKSFMFSSVSCIVFSSVFYVSRYSVPVFRNWLSRTS